MYKDMYNSPLKPWIRGARIGYEIAINAVFTPVKKPIAKETKNDMRIIKDRDKFIVLNIANAFEIFIILWKIITDEIKNMILKKLLLNKYL